jgi:hypothetical protein
VVSWDATGCDPDDAEAAGDCPAPSARWTISNGALTTAVAIAESDPDT